MQYKIIVDSACNLTENDFTEKDIGFSLAPLSIHVGSKEYLDCSSASVSAFLEERNILTALRHLFPPFLKKGRLQRKRLRRAVLPLVISLRKGKGLLIIFSLPWHHGFPAPIMPRVLPKRAMSIVKMSSLSTLAWPPVQRNCWSWRL